MIDAHGKVITHESRILETTLKLACLVINPMPKSEPTETCVVETGTPSEVAKITRNPVPKFAENACPEFIAVISLLIFSATFRALIKPSMAIAKPTKT